MLSDARYVRSYVGCTAALRRTRRQKCSDVTLLLTQMQEPSQKKLKIPLLLEHPITGAPSHSPLAIPWVMYTSIFPIFSKVGDVRKLRGRSGRGWCDVVGATPKRETWLAHTETADAVDPENPTCGKRQPHPCNGWRNIQIKCTPLPAKMEIVNVHHSVYPGRCRWTRTGGREWKEGGRGRGAISKKQMV